MRKFGLAALIAAMAAAGAANATMVTETYDVTFGDFQDLGLSPPIATISGSFTLTFDPAVSVSGLEITTNAFSASLFGPSFYYAVFPAAGADPLRLAIGDVQDSPGNAYYGQDNFGFGLVLPTPDTPALWLCNTYGSDCGAASGYVAGYTSSADSSALWVANSGSVAAVPEPAVWTMMLAGFAGIGLVGRRAAPVRIGRGDPGAGSGTARLRASI